MIGEGLKPTEGIQTPGIDTSKLDSDWQRILAQSEKNRLAKQAEAQKKIAENLATQQTIESVHQIDLKGVPDSIKASVEPTVKPSITAPVAPTEIPTIADLTNQVVGMAPVAPPATTEQIATEAVEGKKKGRPTKEAAAKAMEGMTFRSDLGPGDNWLYNSFGAEGRKAILAKYNNGNPAGSYENSQQILAKMMQEKITPSRAELPRDIAKQRGVPPPETNYGKLGKAAKMGGIAGLALTAEQAAQAKDLSMLRQIIGESLLPLGATPSGVEPGTLGPEQIRAFQEAQKLGSPYRSLSR
jgi:hypothetical protein